MSRAEEPLVKSYVSPTIARQELHVFLPAGERTAPWPAILLFHGGSWRSGSPKQLFPIASHLAENGIVAVSAGYRLVGQETDTPRDCVSDAFEALAWLRQHAEEFNIDPTRIAVGGASAGGHLALMLCLARDFPRNGRQTPWVPPIAFIGLNAVVSTESERFVAVFSAMNQTLDPTTLVATNAMPPALFFHGDKDAVVPITELRRFEHNSQASGVAPETQIYPGATHGFFNADRVTPEVAADINRRMVDFLLHRFARPDELRSSDHSAPK